MANILITYIGFSYMKCIFRNSLFISLISASSLASAIEFDDFSSKVANLQLNGNSVKYGESLRITPAFWWQAGSAFATKKLKVSKFSTYFKFQITGPFSPYGAADGFTFAIQANSINALGATGPGEGYGGDVESGQVVGGINNSIAVEFDTYQNIEFNDPALPYAYHATT